MKNLKFLLILLSAMFIGFSFSACSDDDDEGESSEIAGTFWTEANPEYTDEVDFLYFSKNKAIFIDGEEGEFTKSSIAKLLDKEGVAYTYDPTTKTAKFSTTYVEEDYDNLVDYNDYEFQITSDGQSGVLTDTYWSSSNSEKYTYTVVLTKKN